LEQTIKDTVTQQYHTLLDELTKLQNDIKKLPKGVIQPRKLKNNWYYYRKYRDGQRVISEYIKKRSLERIREEIRRRQLLEKELRQVKQELKRTENIRRRI
jgi:hypothetical protein